MDGPLDGGLDPHGRRRRQLDRRGAVLQAGHVFQNIGDGTYIHSGSLAIRAAVAAGTNVTYKVLYNDAVAMTGGQSLDGGITVQSIAAQLLAEGVKRVDVVTDEPDKYGIANAMPRGVKGPPSPRPDDGAEEPRRDRRRERHDL